MPNFPTPSEVPYANQIAITRLAELIIRKQKELDSLLYAKAQLSDPEWHDRDKAEEDARQYKIIWPR